VCAYKYVGAEDGFELSLRIDSAGPVRITVQDISKGLPEVPRMRQSPGSPG
jgi:hypothetical protein